MFQFVVGVLVGGLFAAVVLAVVVVSAEDQRQERSEGGKTDYDSG